MFGGRRWFCIFAVSYENNAVLGGTRRHSRTCKTAGWLTVLPKTRWHHAMWCHLYFLYAPPKRGVSTVLQFYSLFSFSPPPSVASLLVHPVSGGQFAGAVLTVVTDSPPWDRGEYPAGGRGWIVFHHYYSPLVHQAKAVVYAHQAPQVRLYHPPPPSLRSSSTLSQGDSLLAWCLRL